MRLRGSGRSKLDRELWPRWAVVAADNVVVVAATAWEMVGAKRAVEERMEAAAAPPRQRVRWASIRDPCFVPLVEGVFDVN